MFDRGSLTTQLQQALLRALGRGGSNGASPDEEAPEVSSSSSPEGSAIVEETAPHLDSALSQQKQGQIATMADLEDIMLWDERGSEDGFGETNLNDLIAYQALHSELADLIGDMSSSLDITPAQSQENQSWKLLVPQRSTGPFPAYLQEPSSEGAVAAAAPTVPFDLEELTKMLLECANALAVDDWTTANKLVNNIRRYANPSGSALQRMTHYFVEALVAKLHGTGADLYCATRKGRPDGFHSRRAYGGLSRSPLHEMAYQFTNSVLLDALRGAKRVHIVTYGILDGRQWPSFMQALAYRLEGPPSLRITAIEFPQPGVEPDEKMNETGNRLRRLAGLLGIPFEFQGFADKWEHVQVSALGLQKNEVLAVCTLYRLRYLPDGIVMPSNPRKTVLERISRMNPKVFVTAFVNQDVNSPFLLNRIPGLIGFMNCLYEIFECTLADYPEERLYLEQEFSGRCILNTVACEGSQRRERGMTYEQWQRLLINAGFKQLALQENWFTNAAELMRRYHNNFNVGRDNGWLLQKWKATVMVTMAVWKPVKSA